MKVEGRSFPKSQQAAICLCFQIFHQRYESSSSPTACLPIHPIPSYPNATELTGVYFKPHFKLSSHLKKYQGTQGQKRAKLNCFVVALFHLSRYPPPPPGAPPAPPPPAVAPPPAPPPFPSPSPPPSPPSLSPLSPPSPPSSPSPPSPPTLQSTLEREAQVIRAQKV